MRTGTSRSLPKTLTAGQMKALDLTQNCFISAKAWDTAHWKAQSIIIPLVLTLQRLHVYGTIPGLILVHVIYGVPISTLIFRNYYVTVPTEMVEASKIDGANFLGIYRWIIFPLSTPGFAVAMIWQFTSIWNDFLFGLIVTPNPASQPITVALNNLAGSYIVQWNVQIAGALLTALPPILVYIFLGKFFLRGLMQGSLKG